MTGITRAETTLPTVGSIGHHARLQDRFTAIRAREAVERQKLEDTLAEKWALDAEIAHLKRGDGPVATWNDDVRIGDPVIHAGSRTVTRSWAWADESGAAVILVQGSILPVPLDDVEVAR